LKRGIFWYTYKSSGTPQPKDQPLPNEMCKKAGPFLIPRSNLV
jgi:hypothetical protein